MCTSDLLYVHNCGHRVFLTELWTIKIVQFTIKGNSALWLLNGTTPIFPQRGSQDKYSHKHPAKAKTEHSCQHKRHSYLLSPNSHI